MSMHSSLKSVHRDKDKTKVNRRTPGQAWASDRKKGRAPTPARPHCPRSHHRSGHGMADELARLAVPWSERRRERD